MRREAIIECRDLACGYGGQPVIEHVNLDVEPGEILAIVGPSGAGKSTLLKTILGMLAPLGGEVRLLGADPRESEARHGRVGVLFQSDALLSSETVLDNVALPLRELTDLPEELVIDTALHKLALVGLQGIEHRLPGDISGGQSRRVALARAAALDPRVILCDEPTGGLDPLGMAKIHDVLLGLREHLGMTVVAITHELAAIRAIADRVVMIDRGGIRAAGTFTELERADDPEVRAFFGERRRGGKEAA